MGCSTGREMKTKDNEGTTPKNESHVLTVPRPTIADGKIGNDYKLYLTKQTLIKFNPGLIQNHYKILNILGQGSFGTVYKCHYKLTGEERAIKLINKKDVQKMEGLQEDDLPNELKIHCLIDHPHIIKTFEYFKDSKNYYIVVEYMEGGSLIQKLKQLKFIDEKTVSKIIEQLLSCVYYLHSNKIAHRDLKPDNTLLNIKDEGEVNIKLIDFGLATIYEDKEVMDMLCGSPYYIAPEVIEERYDCKCDLFSVGCMMYFFLCGRPPFYGPSNHATFDLILHEPHDFEGGCWDQISKNAKDLLNKLLEKNPTKRFSADIALKHPWFIEMKDGNTKPTILPNYKENLQKFLGKSLLEQACAAYVIHHSSHLENEKELRSLFKSIDKSNDGRLTFQELKQGYKEYLNDPFLDAHIEEIFINMDNDGDNFIEYEEFIRASVNIKNNYSKKLLAEAFAHYDADGSGKISSSELKCMLGGDKKEKSQVAKDLIMKIDENGDGEISFEEFLALLDIK
jgi:calcium-dependent protein kinase